MKLLLNVIALAMIFAPICSMAQFTTKIPSNSTIKTGANLSNAPKLTLSKSTLDQIQGLQLDNSLSTIPKIQLNPEDMERNRVKSWEITPSRPITPGMDLSFTGNYSKNAFYITPVLISEVNNRKIFQALNMSVITSMVVEKDFRFTIELENPSQFPRDGEIVVSLGGTNYFLKPEPGKKEVYFLFTNTIPSPQIISFGPAVVNGDWQNPKSYGVTKVKLEELVEAH
ncbi:hypothetical protein [Algoriphagus sp. AK58]|uniref:hypothetical protein n=1 Tax=Algoriphagus sp. AK58 TaxID=1406877 RepID=UPI0016509A9B|nr:hypothetical protein [Algoriphagus sp. AK58]MBC6367060.1 hypothetical protein [Algoriphagus sp. AK58]